MTATQPQRIEAADVNDPVYKMGRDELVTTAVHSKSEKQADKARRELARREWNKLVKQGRAS
jgi:hypothetical protein